MFNNHHECYDIYALLYVVLSRTMHIIQKHLLIFESRMLSYLCIECMYMTNNIFLFIHLYHMSNDDDIGAVEYIWVTECDCRYDTDDSDDDLTLYIYLWRQCNKCITNVTERKISCIKIR